MEIVNLGLLICLIISLGYGRIIMIHQMIECSILKLLCVFIQLLLLLIADCFMHLLNFIYDIHSMVASCVVSEFTFYMLG